MDLHSASIEIRHVWDWQKRRPFLVKLSPFPCLFASELKLFCFNALKNLKRALKNLDEHQPL